MARTIVILQVFSSAIVLINLLKLGGSGGMFPQESFETSISDTVSFLEVLKPVREKPVVISTGSK